MRPPPRTTSPLNITADWPGVTARCGVSSAKRMTPSATDSTRAGTAHERGQGVKTGAARGAPLPFYWSIRPRCKI
jgi:hypothetical protein